MEVEKNFTKFVKFANNFMNIVEFANNFTKFVEFANNFTKFVGLTTFKKFVEAANFTKFVGLTSNFWKVRKTCKNIMRFVDWKVRFKCLKVFLYLSFTHSNVLIGKHKCFMNTFHVSWILFTNKSNSGCYMQVNIIFGTVKKWWLVALL